MTKEADICVKFSWKEHIGVAVYRFQGEVTQVISCRASHLAQTRLKSPAVILGMLVSLLEEVHAANVPSDSIVFNRSRNRLTLCFLESVLTWEKIQQLHQNK